MELDCTLRGPSCELCPNDPAAQDDYISWEDARINNAQGWFRGAVSKISPEISYGLILASAVDHLRSRLAEAEKRTQQWYETLNRSFDDNKALHDRSEVAEAQVSQFREALKRIAEQHIEEEIDEDMREDADYEAGYTAVIREARAALAASQKKGE